MFPRQASRLYSSPASTPTKLQSTLLLLRPPVVSADLPRFQAQYYRYQKELWHRLMWTFPKWFYFRKGTLAEQNFREINKNPVHNNPNMEFLGGRPEIRHQRDRRFKQVLRLPKPYLEGEEGDASAEGVETDRPVVPNSRVTDADRRNDTTSLERRLARTLYLVVSEDKGKTWGFPTFDIAGTPLHTAAEQGLYALGGHLINYFNVSPTPCHVHSRGDAKAFFIKLRILLGAFAAQDANVSFQWLTSDELADHLDQDYYKEIQHLTSDV